MTDADDERDLKRAFARLRTEDAASAPRLERELEAALHGRRARSGWLRLALPAAAAAAVLALIVWRLSPVPPAASPAAPPLIALGSLRSPTDALLEMPGRDLLGVMPASLIPGPPLPPRPSSSNALVGRNHA